MAAARSTVEPSACQRCDISRREHARQWTDDAGRHPWTAPTDEQVKARMLARRAVRLAPPDQVKAGSELIVTITLDARPLSDAIAAAQRALGITPAT